MAKVVDATNAAVDILRESGFEAEDARRDVSVLARHVLRWTLADWAARSREAAPSNFNEQLSALAKRRATHEPIAYITGMREFYGREFLVSPAVLIPRPETEAIVDIIVRGALLSKARNHEGHEGITLVDVGTGSGILAVTLQLESPSARVVATDVSAEALEIASTNAQKLGASVEFVETSLLPTGVLADIVVSNPPYVPERARASLTPDVRDFEPAGALFAGQDGLDVIRALVPAARRALKPGGRLLMEIGQGQADAVAALVSEGGFDLEGITPDLQGIPRIVIARRPVSAS